MIQLVATPSARRDHGQLVPLRLATQLVARLNANAVRYCHWKSNQSLREAFTGVGDLDLLIHPEDAQQFHGIIAELGFKLFAQPAWQSQSSVVHYYGHDSVTGKLLHLHIYYRLITGGHLLKNYRLPLERMLLQQRHMEHGALVADRAAELAVFVLRKMLEAGGWIELLLQRRDREHVQRELNWLLPDDTEQCETLLQNACTLLAEHLPQLDQELWRDGVAMLTAPGLLRQQYTLGRRFRKSLHGLALHGPIAASVSTMGRVVRTVSNRLLRRRSRKWPAHGGSVVAVVGPEASGKSTYSEALCTWLSRTMVARAVHLGKPQASLLGRVANVARRVRRRWRADEGREDEGVKGREDEGVKERIPGVRSLFAVASVVLARDRYRLAKKAYRDAARGMIVVCDRYPTQEPGAVDGPRLGLMSELSKCSWLVRWAAGVEQRYYDRIPSPDIVLQLSVPVSVAQQRNRQRVKLDKEDDLYLALRHQQFHAGRAEGNDIHVIDTEAPMEAVLRRLRERVWNNL